MNKMKSSLDFQSMKPILYINKEEGVPSWFGAITTILAWMLAFLFCLSQIQEVIYQTSPVIIEDYFDPLSDGTDISFDLPDKFLLKFAVYSYKTKKYLDTDTFIPDLYIYYWNYEGEREYFDIDLYKCPEYNGSPIFCISPNQTKTSKEKMKMFLRQNEVATLHLILLPCNTNNSEYNSTECASDEEIDEALSDVAVEMRYQTNEANIYRAVKNQTGSFVSFGVGSISTSITEPKSATYEYEVENYTEISPLSNLFSFIYSPKTETIISLKEIKKETYEYDGTFFFASWKFATQGLIDFKSGKRTHTADGKSYIITYRSIQEVWASISSFKDLLLFIIPLALNFMGYFEGNYFSEAIYTFFGENEKFSLDNRKKILNIYDRAYAEEKHELFPISLSINSEGDSDFEKEKEIDKKEKLINQRGIEFSRVNKIWDGAITQLIKCFFCCKYFKSDKWKEDNSFFTQAKKIISNYSDIIFIMRKNFEFELMKKNEENIKPKIVSCLDMNDEEHFYKNWLKAQQEIIDIQA